jgi:hypothetical protein
MKRVYRNFPSNKTAQVYKSRYEKPLGDFVARLYDLDGYVDKISTFSTGLGPKLVEVERKFRCCIAEKGMFAPLPLDKGWMEEVSEEGKIDFRVEVDYYLESFDYQVPLYQDIFLIRAIKTQNMLTLYIHHTRGMQRTDPMEIVKMLEGHDG